MIKGLPSSQKVKQLTGVNIQWCLTQFLLIFFHLRYCSQHSRRLVVDDTAGCKQVHFFYIYIIISVITPTLNTRSRIICLKVSQMSSKDWHFWVVLPVSPFVLRWTALFAAEQIPCIMRSSRVYSFYGDDVILQSHDNSVASIHLSKMTTVNPREIAFQYSRPRHFASFTVRPIILTLRLFPSFRNSSQNCCVLRSRRKCLACSFSGLNSDRCYCITLVFCVYNCDSMYFFRF